MQRVAVLKDHSLSSEPLDEASWGLSASQRAVRATPVLLLIEPCCMKSTEQLCLDLAWKLVVSVWPSSLGHRQTHLENLMAWSLPTWAARRVF